MSHRQADARRHAPSAERNRGPILEVLRGVLPERGLVLEIASGTGQHVVGFASGLPGLDWQPTELAPDLLTSIAAWTADAGPANVRSPFLVDVSAKGWHRLPPVKDLRTELIAIVNVNMIHIAPWTACEGLMRGSGALLGPGGALCLYGPFKRGGRHAAPSNAEFDESLRHRDPTWGVRDLDDVAALAAGHGLDLDKAVDMPVNNLSVIFRRSDRAPIDSGTSGAGRRAA